MAVDDTQTAADFFRLIDAMLFPVHLLDDKLAQTVTLGADSQLYTYYICDR